MNDQGHLKVFVNAYQIKGHSLLTQNGDHDDNESGFGDFFDFFYEPKFDTVSQRSNITQVPIA